MTPSRLIRAIVDIRFMPASCLIPALVGLPLLAALLACSDSSRNAGSMTSFSGTSGGNENAKAELFSVPPDQLAHIQIVAVQATSLPRLLRLTAAVAFNGFLTTPVITQVSGPVSRIVVAPGENVRTGQPLLYVSSPDFSQLLATYLKTRDAYQLADKSYVRSKDLFDHRAIAERDLEAAESARVQAGADLGAAEQSLRIVGITQPDTVVGKPVRSEIPVLAPIGGEVVERLVAPGQVIQAGTSQVITISDMSSVWVLANLYQKDLPYVHLGDAVTITTDAYPGTEFHGNISYLAAALDPTTRTLQARIDVANPAGKLKKDMFIAALVRAGTIANALTVPNAAVLRDAENQPFVYRVTANNQFARRPVTVGETTGGDTQVTSGLAPGDRIVGDGSLFLQFATSLQR
jgi:cobalt-zinc-cadmium efflux system membrane fusion protein